MKVYVVLVEDRHCDAEADSVHTDYDKAEKKAIHLAKKYCKYDEDYEECRYPAPGLLFSATYSCEDGMISVTESELID